jgi:acetyltransferase-like isoleucine patch superfamily enzyme
MVHKNVSVGENAVIQESVHIGIPARKYLGMPEEKWPVTFIGDNAIVRAGSIIYCAVKIGNNFQTGHNVMIREEVTIGDNVLVGTNTVIDGTTRIGDHVSIQSCVYLPTYSTVEDYVFIGPGAVFTNDKYPIRVEPRLAGPVIRRGATIGANATVLPGIEIGEGAVVAAGAVVTRNVPAWSLALGNPAVVKDLPQKLRTQNIIK